MAIRDLARESAAMSRKRVEQQETDGIVELRKAGMQIRTLTLEERASFQKALEPVYAEFAKRFGKANIDAIANVK